MAKRAFSAAQCRWIGERWEEGYTQTELAEFLGVTRETIRRVLLRQGLRSVCREALPPLDIYKEEWMAITKGAAHGT